MTHPQNTHVTHSYAILTTMWFSFALLSSVVAALCTVYNKHALKTVSPRLLAWALFAIPIPFLIAGLFFYPTVSVRPMFWVGVAGSAALFVVSKLWQLEALQTGLLSKLMPLSPLVVLFSYVLGLVFLGERVSSGALAGMLIIIIGAYLLNIHRVREGLLSPFLILVKERESLLYILSLLFGALTSVFDKIGLTNVTPANPALTLLTENVLTVIPFTVFLMVRESGWVRQLRQSFPGLLLAGILYAVSVIFIFYGFSSGPIALSVAIRQSQILFVIGLGFLLYKDKPPAQTWLATFVMIAGVILLKLA